MKKVNLVALGLLFVSLVFISCENETLTSQPDTSNASFAEFLEDNEITQEGKFVIDGQVIEISSLKNKSTIEEMIFAYNNAYSLIQDGSFYFIYNEEQSNSLDLDAIDHYEYNKIQNFDKASNPVFYTLTVFKNTKFRGRRIKFTIRRKEAKRIANAPVVNDNVKSKVIRLSKIRNGRFVNNISSFKWAVTKAALNSNVGVEVFFSDSFSIKDEALGGILPTESRNPITKVNIPNLKNLKFDRDGFSPKGIFSSQIPDVTNWDDKIKIIDMAFFM